MTTLWAFLLALAVLIVVHELGHYVVARCCGVKVLRFSFGFGKVLWRYQASPAQTEWVVSLVPLGGYVKMLDERESDCAIASADLPFAFNRQSLGKRAAIVAAGPLANFILALGFFWVIALLGSAEPKAILAQPPANSVAALSGLQAGDEIIAVNGQRVQTWPELQKVLLASIVGNREINIEWQRADLTHTHAQLYQAHLMLPSNHTPLHIESNTLQKLGLSLQFPSPRVTQVDLHGPAAAAGLKENDVILQANGVIPNAEIPLPRIIHESQGQPVELLIARKNTSFSSTQLQRTVQPKLDSKTQTFRIGLTLAYDWPSVKRQYGILDGFQAALHKTWEISALTLQLLGKMLVGQASLQNLSGPFSLAEAAGQSAQISGLAYLNFLALVSISLAIFNLLPIPLLDGGHLLYYCVEFFTGRPPSEAILELTQKIGLGVLLVIMSVAIFNDLIRYLL